MYQLIIIVFMFVCMGLIALVLIQQGKGADIGASFGSGASQTVFGSQGAGSFMLKLTGSLAAAFFALSLMLGAMATQQSKQSQSVLLKQPAVTSSQETAEPVAPSEEVSEDESVSGEKNEPK